MKIFLSHLALIFTLALIASCTGSKEDKDKQSVLLEKRTQEAQEARDKALALGADKLFAEDFEQIEKSYQDAENLVEEGKGDKAVSKFSSAKRRYEELIQRATEQKANLAAAEEEKKKAEKLIAKAKKDKVDVDAEEAFKDIEETMAQVNADFKDPKKAASSARTYKRIIEMIQGAQTVAKETQNLRAKAETGLKDAKEGEAKAKQERAEEFALEELTRGQSTLKQAEVDFKDGRYREALDGCQMAMQVFTEAITKSRAEKEFRAANAPPPEQKIGEKPEAKEGEATPKEETPKVAEKEPPATPPTPPEKEDKKGLEPVPVADSELPPEDEEFLQRNISKLVKAEAQRTYDPTTGEFTVEFPFGDQLKKDVIFPRPVDPKYIQWKENIGGMTMGSKEAKGQKDSASLGMSFEGNTQGLFLIQIPFKESITMEYKVDLGLMKSEGALTAILMADEKGKSYYGLNFVTIEAWMDGKKAASRPSPEPKYQKSPNMWFNKLKPVNMRVKYEPHPKEPKKKGQVTVWYDTDEDEDPDNTFSVPARSGYPGFSWYVTKFKVRQLKIAGKLDKPAAVKLLRSRLGEPAADAGSGKTAKKAANPPGGTEEAGTGAEGGDAAPPPKAAKETKKKSGDAKKPAAGGDDADY